MDEQHIAVAVMNAFRDFQRAFDTNEATPETVDGLKDRIIGEAGEEAAVRFLRLSFAYVNMFRPQTSCVKREKRQVPNNKPKWKH